MAWQQVEKGRAFGLEEVILNDLQERPPFGISWWDSRMDTAHRILISDQLYTCATSV